MKGKEGNARIASLLKPYTKHYHCAKSYRGDAQFPSPIIKEEMIDNKQRGAIRADGLV